MGNRLCAMLAVMLLILGSGCQRSGDGSAPLGPAGTETTQQIDLDSPTGGFTSTDELPAFGEPDEFLSFADESAVEDTCEDNPGIRNMLRMRGARLYEFRAVWGRLADLGDSNATDLCPLDWSGTLHLEGGVIIMEKTIAFEPEDSISRVDKSTISWVSHTGPYVDGIHVKLVVPARPLDSLVTPQLELSTGPFSRIFTLAELAALNLVEAVDSCGNAISITSVMTAIGCPHGQLMGGWAMTPPDTLTSADSTNVSGVVQGVFRGVWVGEHGRVSGYLKGIYGLNSSDERVFFGKYIDMQGHFMGILRGRFGSPGPGKRDGDGAQCPDPKRPHGWFKGEWIDDKVNVQGRLQGHWIANDEGKGLFHGVWGMRCSENL
jgi:hypothetical protein